MKYPVLAALALACGAGPLPTSADQAALTYTAFEPGVTHLDLESCPAALAREGVFCRLSIGGDMVHVWAFEEAGDMKLVEVQSFDPNEYEFVLK